MPWVIGDESGFPKRCFTFSLPDGRKTTFCIVWVQWPSFLWRRPQPDPGPERYLEIEGVRPELLRDLEIVDTIRWLSTHLSSELAKPVEAAAAQSIRAIQEKMPQHLSMTLE